MSCIAGRATKGIKPSSTPSNIHPKKAAASANHCPIVSGFRSPPVATVGVGGTVTGVGFGVFIATGSLSLMIRSLGQSCNGAGNARTRRHNLSSIGNRTPLSNGFSLTDRRTAKSVVRRL